MSAFQWGTFEELLDFTRLEEPRVSFRRDRSGAELGSVDLGSDTGTGTIEYFASDSLRVVVLDCSFRTRRTFVIQDRGWLRLNFALDLDVDMTFGDEMQVRAREPRWRFLRLADGQRSIETLFPGVKARWVTVCCHSRLMRKIAGVNPSELARVAGPESDRGLVHHCFSFTPPLRQAVKDIFARPVTGRMQVPYFTAKAHELLILSADHMLGTAAQSECLSRSSAAIRLSERDVRALHAVRSFIDANLGNLSPVRELSGRAGMNRTKMFYGFKQLFGKSLSRHIQDRRVEEGYRLLTTTDAPVGEIASHVGFQFQCNFSTAIKARYGEGPVALRRRATLLRTAPRGRE